MSYGLNINYVCAWLYSEFQFNLYLCSYRVIWVVKFLPVLKKINSKISSCKALTNLRFQYNSIAYFWKCKMIFENFKNKTIWYIYYGIMFFSSKDGRVYSSLKIALHDWHFSCPELLMLSENYSRIMAYIYITIHWLRFNGSICHKND